MQKTILSLFIIFLGGVSVFYAYSSNLYGPFVYDDIWQIVDSPDIENPQYFTANNWRIIPNLTLWLNYNLGPQLEDRNTITTVGGESLYYWHITNIVLHFMCAVVFFLFCRYLKFPYMLSIVTSAIFLVHPLASEAVNYIQARSMILLTLFLLLSIIYRDKGIAFVLFCVCAIFCKEVACFYLLAIHLVFSPQQKRQPRQQIWVLFGLCGVIILLLSPAIYQRLVSGDFFSNASKQFVAFWYYAKLFIYPAATQLSFDHTTQNFSQGLGSFIAVILTLIILYKLNNKLPLRAFGACFIILLPYILIPTNFVVVEYRAYPLLAFFLVVMASIVLLIHNVVVQQVHKFYQKQQSTLSKKKFLYFLAHSTLVSISIVLLLVLSQETRKRSSVWQTAISIYGDTVDKGSTRPSIRFNFCMAYTSTAQWMWENKRRQIARIYFAYGKQHIGNYIKESENISEQHLFNLRLQLLKVYEVEEDFVKILSLTDILKKQVAQDSPHYSLLLLLEAQTYLQQGKSKECEDALLQLESSRFAEHFEKRRKELQQKLQHLQKRK